MFHNPCWKILSCPQSYDKKTSFGNIYQVNKSNNRWKESFHKFLDSKKILKNILMFLPNSATSDLPTLQFCHVASLTGVSIIILWQKSLIQPASYKVVTVKNGSPFLSKASASSYALEPFQSCL